MKTALRNPRASSFADKSAKCDDAPETFLLILHYVIGPVCRDVRASRVLLHRWDRPDGVTLVL